MTTEYEPAKRVRSLADYGASVEVDSTVPARRYLRSGQEMMRMADVYYEEHNWEHAFVLYTKFITIFVEKLPKHPGYSEVKSTKSTEIKKNMKMIKLAFPRAEETKGKLLVMYQKEFDLYKKQKQREQEEEERREEEHRRKLEEEKKIREAEQALLEQERKRIEEEKAKQITEEQHRLLEEQKMALKQAEEQQKILQQQRASQIEEERIAEMEKRKPPVIIPTPVLPPGPPPPASSSPQPGQNTVNFNSAGGVPSQSPMPGAIPMPGMVFQQPSAPSMPNDSLSPPPMAPQVDRSKKIDRSSKPNHLMQPTPASAPVNHYGLRDVCVPLDAVPKFLALARQNTSQNLETCGILAGRLARNAFSVTHIVIPKQTSTSDSCTALNEEDIFDCMDNNDLITLGWIHTHPTQTAFMSSIDLHTHCPYQIMLSEAIAIVCAPAHNETGVFSLTPNYGLNYILSCKQTGFHPHPKHPLLYEELNHVKMRGDLSTLIKDLR